MSAVSSSKLKKAETKLKKIFNICALSRNSGHKSKLFWMGCLRRKDKCCSGPRGHPRGIWETRSNWLPNLSSVKFRTPTNLWRFFFLKFNFTKSTIKKIKIVETKRSHAIVVSRFFFVDNFQFATGSHVVYVRVKNIWHYLNPGSLLNFNF